MLNKEELILLIIGILLGIFIMQFIELKKTPLIEENIQSNPDINQFLKLGFNFSRSHEYNRTDYNCVNFSQDFKKLAEEKGFKVKTIVGKRSENGTEKRHMWLVLELSYDPISSKFVDYSKLYEIIDS